MYVKDSDQVESVAQQFIGNPAVDDATLRPGPHDSVVYAKKTVRRMLGIINLIEKGMWVATAVFGVAAILLISTTVRLSIFARRREIEIMRLVGATNWFIRWPFVLEGFMTGLVVRCSPGPASTRSTGPSSSGSRARSSVTRGQDLPAVVPERALAARLMPSLALLGAVLGSVGGGFALRRYLKV